ncbi:tetratricopeptide repeat protein [Belnapia sp. T6]|uniref:protein O-GlcNAc transferase n=1 Tax=Belnapia mucosa TaxID=2804532 RepID=A0ABS1VC65_9PROT|nr:tetratricopeptide repeat protein [Belnapia mucosa]MBL6459256.1 tetratricopeptide repeat protein [Belnapia mucosa]
MPETATLFAEALRRHRAGDAAGAEAGYRAVLAARPGDAQARHNLAVLAHARGEAAMAERLCREALAGAPGDAEILNTLGVALRAQGRVEEALACYRAAIAAAPGYAAALQNLGRALLDRSPVEALAAFAAAARAAPASQPAVAGLGRALQRLGRAAEAADAFRRALALGPDPDAALDLGNILEQAGDAEGAAAVLRAAAAQAPADHRLPYALGRVLASGGRRAAAAECFRRALALAPGFLPARIQLLHLRQWLLDWDGLAAEEASILAALWRGEVATSPFPVLAMRATPEEQLLWARAWSARIAARAPRLPPAAPPIHADDRLRLGYLSADFRAHPLASLVTGLIEAHDRRRVEVIGCCLSPEDGSPARRRLLAGFDQMLMLRDLSDAEAAARIRAAGIEVLVDLTGHTQGARTEILAARPAPVQAQWLGYVGTMGADFIDYILADDHVIPPGAERCFAERVVRLPGPFQPPDPGRRPIGPEPDRAAAGLPEDALVLCCFNAPYKITAEVFGCWMAILRAVPRAVLWLLEDAGPALAHHAAAAGIDPARLILAPRIAYDRHLARCRLADLFLDTWPYNAGATAADALSAGLPVLTMSGPTYASRMAGSLLHAAGLPALVTATPEAYVAQAIALASDPARRAAARARLAARDSAFFDLPGFTSGLEDAFLRMRALHRAGEAPRDLA